MRWRMAPASVQQRVLIEGGFESAPAESRRKADRDNPQRKCDGQRVEGLVIENPFIG